MKIIWSKENFIIERMDVDEPVEEPKKPDDWDDPATDRSQVAKEMVDKAFTDDGISSQAVRDQLADELVNSFNEGKTTTWKTVTDNVLNNLKNNPPEEPVFINVPATTGGAPGRSILALPTGINETFGGDPIQDVAKVGTNGKESVVDKNARIARAKQVVNTINSIISTAGPFTTSIDLHMEGEYSDNTKSGPERASASADNAKDMRDPATAAAAMFDLVDNVSNYYESTTPPSEGGPSTAVMKSKLDKAVQATVRATAARAQMVAEKTAKTFVGVRGGGDGAQMAAPDLIPPEVTSGLPPDLQTTPGSLAPDDLAALQHIKLNLGDDSPQFKTLAETYFEDSTSDGSAVDQAKAALNEAYKNPGGKMVINGTSHLLMTMHTDLQDPIFGKYNAKTRVWSGGAVMASDGTLTESGKKFLIKLGIMSDGSDAEVAKTKELLGYIKERIVEERGDASETGGKGLGGQSGSGGIPNLHSNMKDAFKGLRTDMKVEFTGAASLANLAVGDDPNVVALQKLDDLLDKPGDGPAGPIDILLPDVMLDNNGIELSDLKAEVQRVDADFQGPVQEGDASKKINDVRRKMIAGMENLIENIMPKNSTDAVKMAEFRSAVIDSLRAGSPQAKVMSIDDLSNPAAPIQVTKEGVVISTPETNPAVLGTACDAIIGSPDGYTNRVFDDNSSMTSKERKAAQASILHRLSNHMYTTGGGGDGFGPIDTCKDLDQSRLYSTHKAFLNAAQLAADGKNGGSDTYKGQMKTVADTCKTLMSQGYNTDGSFKEGTDAEAARQKLSDHVNIIGPHFNEGFSGDSFEGPFYDDGNPIAAKCKPIPTTSSGPFHIDNNTDPPTSHSSER